MSTSPLDFLDAQTFTALATAAPSATCPQCTPLRCDGWESLPATFDQAQLRCVGTLCDPHIEDPTLLEYHPASTHGWSADAPIALAYFPYNRCTVWACTSCAKVFLRYTEYGGYYVDERIRAVNTALMATDAPNIER